MQDVFSFLHTDECLEEYNRYTLEDVSNYLKSTKFPVISLDIETEGLDCYNKNTHIKSIGIVWEECNIFKGCGLLNKDFEVKKLDQLFKINNLIIIGHNIKFDFNWLRVRYNIEPQVKLFDTLISSYLLDENLENNTLDTLVKIYLPGEFDASDYASDKAMRGRIGMFSDAHLLNYNLKDARATLKLAKVLWNKLGERQLLAILGSNIQNTLSHIETTGTWIDFEYAKDKEQQLLTRALEIRKEINELTSLNINPSSSLSLIKTLKSLGFKLHLITNSGQYSTNSTTLFSVKQENSNNLKGCKFIDLVLEYKKILKLYTTYYNPMQSLVDKNNRIHTNYFLGKQRGEAIGGTVTGRLSSSNPNLQNLPRDKELRGMFCAPKGSSLLDCDFSQLELVVAAYLSQEPLMIEAFEKGLDIHTSVMADLKGISYSELVTTLSNHLHPDYTELKNERVAIKRINFGILYGIAGARLQTLLAVELNITWTLEQCNTLIKQWLIKYPKIASWIKLQHKNALTFGYVKMPMGQIRHLEAGYDTPEGLAALRQASNFPVQSFASWICLLGLHTLEQYLQTLTMKARIILQVHDSVTIEIETEDKNVLTYIEKYVKMIMEDGVKQILKDVFNINFNVPLKLNTIICKRWS